jgi:ParB/Sulfiredoxin domain
VLTDTDADKDFQPVRLGKKIELKYIPFSELAIPWSICPENTNQRQEIGNARQFSHDQQANAEKTKPLKTIRKTENDSLKRSIAQFGLLKPFEVAELHERLDFFYGKGRYLVIDGQRRYFAIRDLLKLPTEDEERKQKEELRTNCQLENVIMGEIQAQEQFNRLSIRDYVLIPCIVYPYTTLLQMHRHSIEDKRFSEKPSKEELALADKMSANGMSDLYSDDLRELWKMRNLIDNEKRSIEKTLEQIRKIMKKSEP